MKKLVLDIGGTAIKYATMDTLANIYDKGKIPTPHDGLETFVDTICQLYQQYKEEVDGIALSMPGNIDSDTGQIYAPGSLTYNANINIIKELNKFIDVSITVENDGKSAALAELWKGNLKDCQDGIVLVLGSGIGGGIIHNRQVIKGNHFFAGEVSYLMTDLKDASFQNIFAMQASTIALVMKVAKKKNIDASTIDGKLVFQWIEQKDPIAMQAFDEMTTALANQIYNLQCLLDPCKILIGGGVSKQPLLLQEIQKKLDTIYQQIPFPIARAQVGTCAYYNDSNLIGALYHYISHFGG